MLPSINFNVVNKETTRYVRTHNYPVQETEEKLKELYGHNCWKVVMTNSGQEALMTAVELIQPKTVIVDDETYFELRFMLRYMKDWCCFDYIQLADLDDPVALSNALKKARKPILVCGDNPTTFGNWKNVRNISNLCHSYGAYVMIDNSIVSLYYSNPLDDGADILVESYSKYVTGQGDTMAGGIAFAHSMEWLDDKPLPAEVPGMKSIAWITSRRGNVAHALAAFNVSKGLETLAVRMERHTLSATNIYATLLSAGLDVRYSGKGGLITLLGIKPDFCKNFKHIVTVGTFGCAYTNADFFRSDAYYKTGVCTRLSIGLEDVEYLLEDIGQAMNLPLLDIYRKNMKKVVDQLIPIPTLDEIKELVKKA